MQTVIPANLLQRIDAAIALHPTKPWRTSRLRSLKQHMLWAMNEGDWIERQFFHEWQGAIDSACLSAEYVEDIEASLARPAESYVPGVAS